MNRKKQVAESRKAARAGRFSMSLRPLCVALCTGLLWFGAADPARSQATAAAVLPQGGRVVHGQATISTTGSALRVTTGTDKTALDWQSFSIGQANSVYFQQPGANSQVLNRVLGQDPSRILGTLQSNGQVWLLNPNGVIFGREARVDVAGLVASTLDLSTQNFLDGRYSLRAAPGSRAEVINQGQLRTPYGGQVVLVGHSVSNEGHIDTPGGQAALLGASSVDLADTATPYLTLRVNTLDGQVRNTGSVAAGRIDLHGAVVKQDGALQASTLQRDAQGHIVLVAAQEASTGAGSVTQAHGGRIDITAGPGSAVSLGGGLSVASTQGQGGQLKVNGGDITVATGARLDASGAQGGGSIEIGGAPWAEGGARTLQVQAGAVATADATLQGQGGRIVLWSTDRTTVAGQLSARGGAQGGDGGFIETSAARRLDVRSTPDASAPKGKAGTWLLDPYDITIAATGAGSLSGDAFTSDSTASVIGADVINAALNASTGSTNVVIKTGSGGTALGDITVSAPIAKTSGSDAALTLDAAGSIYLDANITSTSGRLGLNLQTGGGLSTSTLGPGASSLLVDLNGGTLTFNGNLAFAGALRNLTLRPDAPHTLIGDYANLEGVTLDAGPAAGRTLNLLGNFEIPGDLLLADGATVSASSGLFFIGGTTAGVQQSIALAPGASSAVMRLVDGAFLEVGDSTRGNSLTIAPGVSVRGEGFIYTLDSTLGGRIVNRGVIEADVRNRELSIQGGSSADGTVAGFVNEGTLRASSGGTLRVGVEYFSGGYPVDLWTSGAGSRIELAAGTVVLGGVFSSADLRQTDANGNSASIVTGSGEVQVSGRVNLGNDTVDIGPGGLFGPTGISLIEGALVGNAGGTAKVTVLSNQPYVLKSGDTSLENVILDSGRTDRTLSMTGYFSTPGDLRLAPGMTLQTDARWDFQAGRNADAATAISQNIAVAGAGVATLNLSQGGSLIVDLNQNGSSLDINAGVTVRGAGAISPPSYGNGQLINRGVIEASEPGQALSIQGLSLVNAGTLKASGGILEVLRDIDLDRSWTAAPGGSSRIVVDGGTVRLGGAIARDALANTTVSGTGGSIYLTGRLDLGGGSLDIAPNGVSGDALFGPVGLAGVSGTLANGTVYASNPAIALPGGDDREGSRGTLSGITLGAAAGQVLNATGEFLVGNDLTLTPGTTVNLQAAGASAPVWTFALSVADPFTGTTGIKPSAGSSFNILGGGVVNTDAFFTIGAGVTVNVGAANGSSAGTLSLSSPISWTNEGAIALGSAGTLNLGGSFSANDIASRLGNFTRLGGGAVHLTGSFNLADSQGGNSSLDIHTGVLTRPAQSPIDLLKGPLNSIGGTLLNGTVYSSGSTALQSSPLVNEGQLSNITLGSAAHPALAVRGEFAVGGSGISLADGAVIQSSALWRGFDSGLIQVASPLNGAVFNVNGGAVYGGDGLRINPGVTMNVNDGGTLAVGEGFLHLGVVNINAGGSMHLGNVGYLSQPNPGAWQNDGVIRLLSGGALSLGGKFSGSDVLARLGTALGTPAGTPARQFTREPGSTLNITGVMNLAPDTSYALDIATGTLRDTNTPTAPATEVFQGKVDGLAGVLSGGNVFSSDAAIALKRQATGSPALDGVTVGYAYDPQTDPAAGLTLLAQGSFSISPSGLKLAPGATLNLESPAGAGSAPSLWQFDPNSSLQAPQGPATVNIRGGATVSGLENFTIGTGVTVNVGTTDGSSAGRLVLGGPNQLDFSFAPGLWTNNGSINLLNSGALNLGGKFNANDIVSRLGTFQREGGGTVNLIGAFDLFYNATPGGASSLDIHTGLLSRPGLSDTNLLRGPLNSVSGSLARGTFYSSGSTVLRGGTSDAFNAATYGLLSDVTLGTTAHPLLAVAGAFSVDPSGQTRLRLGDGATVNSTADWTVFSSALGTTTPSGTGTFNIQSGTVQAGASLQIDPGITVNINGGFLTAVDGLTQRGTVNIEAGGTLNLGLLPFSSWTNGGTIALKSGGTLNLGGTFDAVDIGVDGNSGIRLGSFTREAASRVNITGTLSLGYPASEQPVFAMLDVATGSLRGASGNVSPGLRGPVGTVSGGITGGVVYSSDPSRALEGSDALLQNVTLGRGVANSTGGEVLLATGSFRLPGDLVLADGLSLQSTAAWAFGSSRGGQFEPFRFPVNTENRIRAVQADLLTPGSATVIQTGSSGQDAPVGFTVTGGFSGPSTIAIDPGITLRVAGNVALGASALSEGGSTLVVNRGNIDMTDGSRLDVAAPFVNESTGTLASGSASISLGVQSSGFFGLPASNNVLLNLGTLAVGSTGTGPLSVFGDLHSVGTVAVRAGATPQISVAGEVRLGETAASALAVSGSASGSYDFITSTGLMTGAFTSFSPAGAGFNGAIVPGLGDGSIYRLSAGPATCAGICWDGGGGSSDWYNATNWTGNQLPGASDTVYLNLVSGATVQHASGTTSILSLNSIANNALQISGGSLTLTDAAATSTLLGNLTVSGSGSLTIAGAASLRSLTLSGGTLGGTGSLTVGQSFSRTGGTFGSTFTGVSITQASGDLAPGALSVAGPLSLTTLDSGSTLLINDVVRTTGSTATMTVQAAGSLEVGNGSQTTQAVLESAGSQTITATDILVQGGGSGSGRYALVAAAGSQDIVARNGMSLLGGAAGGFNSARVDAYGLDQSVHVGPGGLSITGGGGADTGNAAILIHVGSGTQTVTAASGGFINLAGGSSAIQTTSANGGSYAVLRGDGAAQNITFTGVSPGSLIVLGGTVGAGNVAHLTAVGQQTIGGATSITVTGGSSGDGSVSGQGNDALIFSQGSQTISAGSLAITGGAGGPGNGAAVSAATQNILLDGGNLTVTGGTGSTNVASLFASGNQTIAGASALTLTGGEAGTGNFAQILAFSDQSISAGGIALHGGVDGTGNYARILSRGTQSLTTTGVEAGGTPGAISLTGGAGSGNYAWIVTETSSLVQSISAGSLSVTGGAQGIDNYSEIFSTGPQQVTLVAGTNATGAVSVTGGASGSNNFANIGGAGTQTVSGITTLTITGGTGGTSNWAEIAAGGVQNISSGELHVIGGSGTLGVFSNSAGIFQGVAYGAVAQQTITLGSGVLSLTGGSGPSGNEAYVWADGPQTISGVSNLAITGGTTGSGNSAYIHSGSGAQSISAASIQIQGGASGTGNAGFVEGAGAVKLQTTGNVILGAGATVSSTAAGDALVLAAGGNFTNEAGATALSAPNGRWLVYSTDPAADTVGGLAYDFKHYGQTYGGQAYAGPGVGNGLLYSSALPALSVSVTGGPFTKTYDGTTAATVLGSDLAATGALNGDTVTLANPTAVYNSKDVLTANTITVSGISVAGATDIDAKPIYGYLVDTVSLSAQGSITPASVSAAGLSASSKVYDGGTAATVTAAGAGLGGVIGNDVVSLSLAGATGVFSDKNVGQAKTVSIGGLSLGGADAGNYTLLSTTSTATADITPATLTLSGLGANSKVYDGTTVATLNGAGATLAGVIGTDAVNLNLAGASGAFADKNAGTDKAVSISGIALGGADASNYALASGTASTNASITVRPLSTWTGASSLLWSDPGNWDVVPDGANVAVVSIPAGANVNYNTAAGNTTLQSLGDGGALSITGGTLTVGSITVAGGASLTLAGGGFSSTSINNAGNVTLATGSLDLSGKSVLGAGTFTNQGQLTLSGSTLANTLVNATGASVLASGSNALGAMSNSGLLQVSSGSSSMSGAYSQTSTGVLRLGDATAGTSSTLAFAPGAVTSLAGGEVRGSGTLVGDLSLAAVRLAPGASPGALTVQGALQLSPSSVIAVEIGGTTPGTGFDTLTVTGAAALAGTLEVARWGVFTPGPTDAFDIIRYASATGDFAQVNYLTPTDAWALSATLGPAAYALAVSAAAQPLPFIDSLTLIQQAPVRIESFGQPLSATGTDLGVPTLVGPTAVTDPVQTSATTASLDPLILQVQAYQQLVAVATSGSSGYILDATQTIWTDLQRQAAALARMGGVDPSSAATAGGSTAGASSLGGANVSIPAAGGGAGGASATAGSAGVTVAGSASTPAASTGGVAPSTGGAVASTGSAASSSGSAVASTSGTAASTGGAVTSADGAATNTGGAVASTGGAATGTVSAAANTSGAAASSGGTAASSGSAAAATGTEAANSSTTTGVAGAAIASAGPAASPPVSVAGAADSSAKAGTDRPLPAGTVQPHRYLVADGNRLFFRVLPLSDMSMEARSQLLSSRSKYKKALFADAIAQLERNPALPDLPDCGQGSVSGGDCLINVEAAQANSLPEALSRQRPDASVPQIQRKVALVIGLNGYDDRRIPQLINAGPDSAAVGETLASQLGYEVVRLADPTKAQIFQALNTLAASVRADDSLIVYFAGHGELVERTGLGYWIPRDASANDPRTWISNTDINRVLTVARSQQIAVVADSCYSGALARESGLGGGSSGQRLEDYLSRRAVTVMTSGGDEPVADEGKDGHSVFAFNLMKQLRGLTDWAPGTRLYLQLRDAVSRELPQTPGYGASLSAGHQTGADFLFERRRKGP